VLARQKSEPDRLRPCTAECIKEWRYTITLPIWLHGMRKEKKSTSRLIIVVGKRNRLYMQIILLCADEA